MKINRKYAIAFTINRLYRATQTYPRFLSNTGKNRNVTESAAPKVTCWKCDKTIELNRAHSHTERYFCPCELKVVLPLEKYANYFSIFDSLPTFNIDNSRLKRNYLKLQYKFHPDRFSKSSQREQDMAAEHSAVISTSYNTLCNTYSRAVYLLLLEGIDLEQSNITSEMSPEFLMEMFETNEKLENGISGGELSELKLQTEQQISKCYSDLIHIFSRRDYEKAKSIVAKLQYYRNIMVKIGELQLF